MDKQKGFTLVELILVIAIIGFLAAILIPAVGNIGAKAKERAVRADLKTIRTAIEYYKVDFAVYPATLTLLTNVTDRLVDTIPDDPYAAAAGTKYRYDLDTAGRHTYVVWSIGPNATSNLGGAGNDTLDATPVDDIYQTNAKTIP